MKNKKIKALVGVIIVLVIVVAGVVLYLGRKADPAKGITISRKEIENIAMISKASFGYPKMMDAESRADDVRVNEKDEFEIAMTLVNVTSSSPTFTADVERLKGTLPASACEKAPLRFLLYKGITAKLVFKSNDGVALFDYILNPGICPE